MPYLLIEDFKNGLDVRKSSVTAPPGTLLELENAHITRGGEIEKRQAFAVLTQLPAGLVKGMAGAPGVLYLFGQDDLPAGFQFNTTGNASGLNVVYQKLGLPTGITTAELVKITSVEFWGDKPFVVAEWRTDETKPAITPDPGDEEGNQPVSNMTMAIQPSLMTVEVQFNATGYLVGTATAVATNAVGAVTYLWNPIPPQPVNYTGTPRVYTVATAAPDQVLVRGLPMDTTDWAVTQVYCDVTDSTGTTVRAYVTARVSYTIPEIIPPGGIIP